MECPICPTKNIHTIYISCVYVRKNNVQHTRYVRVGVCKFSGTKWDSGTRDEKV